MKKSNLIAFLIVTGLLLACNKEEHWKTSVDGISNITAYSAQLTVNYDFGGKSTKTMAGVDIGTTPDMETNFTRYQHEQSSNGSINFNPSQLYADQTYYVRSYMEGRKGIVYSEIMSFTTLSEPSLSCSVSSGEVYYTGHDLTETVSSLFEVENTSDSDFFTYEVEADIGNLTFTFVHEPSPGLYTVGDEIYNTYGHSLPMARVGCWFDNGGSNCYYAANTNERLYVTKDIDGNISISFCDLKMTKSDTGSCLDTQEISGRLVN